MRIYENSNELIDFKEGCHASFEYGRYGNPTTIVAENKISALEGAESTILMSSGMCASTVMMFALVKKGGDIITTTDCYRKTRIFSDDFLVPNMNITVHVIDPADMDGLESALDKNNVTLPLMCDIELVSKLCHSKGTLVCVDGTFATPLNQNALALGADLVLTGCISGSEEVTSKIHKLHHVLGGTLNPNYTNALCYLNAAYLVIQGMNTLHLRAQQQNIIGLRIAEILEVKRVHYTGLPSYPEHKIAMKQMTGLEESSIGGDSETTKTFIDALKIPYISLSFGGCESIVDQPAIMSYCNLLLRFLVGPFFFSTIKLDHYHCVYHCTEVFFFLKGCTEVIYASELI
ncbi:hypothetical protein MKW92_024937 [Papaver armeniacum]|nr:hypothetical protein MKW92_024937 [Papaver armeniacum]